MFGNTRDDWAKTLGLAAAPLFGHSKPSEHTAMLDGVAGSFVLSDAADVQLGLVDRRSAPDWTWSSMMRNHVLLNKDEVEVTNTQTRTTQRIERSSVESDLERFLTYLESQSGNSGDVVDHIIGTFQGLRAELPGPSKVQLANFLALVALRVDNPLVSSNELPDLVAELPGVAVRHHLDDVDIGALANNKDLVRKFFEQLLTDQNSGRELTIDLTLRHAGAELFQAAQLAPPPPPQQRTLFGMPSLHYAVRPHSLKGVAYTPIGLARSLAEQAVALQLARGATDIVVADYACGSGSFLTEAISALGRAQWTGKVHIVGYDISESAVLTTRFAVDHRCRDYPGLAVTWDIAVKDFLSEETKVEPADIVLMNPPYLSWLDMDKGKQALVASRLGKRYKNRPDLSMVFVDRAVDEAKAGAILTFLLPAGVVAGESANNWRHDLAERAQPKMIAVLGDHSLFRFATVNVAAVTLEKGGDANDEASPGTRMIWASEVSGAASSALRTLRRSPALVVAQSATDGRPWSMYRLLGSELSDRANWLPSPRLLSEEASERLRGHAQTIGDLFEIRTGIRAGDRNALVLSRHDWAALHSSERKGFRPVAEKQAIAGGRIEPTSFFFEAGSQIETESELKQKFPVYFERHLSGAQAALSSRARANGRWWLPSEPRNTWRTQTGPRIVSRQWFRNDGFAVDPDGKYAVVQGYAWFPKKGLLSSLPDDAELIVQALHLYCITFSSDVFFSVVREYSTNSAGGQLNLQQNLIVKVPVPLLSSPNAMNALASFPAYGIEDPFPSVEVRNRMAAALYGFDPNEF